MDNTNLLVVKSENKELLTQEEMAAKLNVSVSAVCKWLNKFNLTPVVPANRTMGIAAKYDIQAFLNLQEEEERKLKERELALIEKHVNALSSKERQTAVRGTLEQVVEDGDMESMMGIAAMMVQGLNQMAQKYAMENTELKRQLDCEENTGTLEKFNEEYNWHATAVQLSVLSRRLGKHYTRVKVVSIEHPDGVWSYERSDVLDSIERFPQFWEGIIK